MPFVDERFELPQKALSNIRNEAADDGSNSNENPNDGSNNSNEGSLAENDEWDEES